MTDADFTKARNDILLALWGKAGETAWTRPGFSRCSTLLMYAKDNWEPNLYAKNEEETHWFAKEAAWYVSLLANPKDKDAHDAATVTALETSPLRGQMSRPDCKRAAVRFYEHSTAWMEVVKLLYDQMKGRFGNGTNSGKLVDDIVQMMLRDIRTTTQLVKEFAPDKVKTPGDLAMFLRYAAKFLLPQCPAILSTTTSPVSRLYPFKDMADAEDTITSNATQCMSFFQTSVTRDAKLLRGPLSTVFESGPSLPTFPEWVAYADQTVRFEGGGGTANEQQPPSSLPHHDLYVAGKYTLPPATGVLPALLQPSVVPLPVIVRFAISKMAYSLRSTPKVAWTTAAEPYKKDWTVLSELSNQWENMTGTVHTSRSRTLAMVVNKAILANEAMVEYCRTAYGEGAPSSANAPAFCKSTTQMAALLQALENEEDIRLADEYSAMANQVLGIVTDVPKSLREHGTTTDAATTAGLVYGMLAPPGDTSGGSLLSRTRASANAATMRVTIALEAMAKAKGFESSSDMLLTAMNPSLLKIADKAENPQTATTANYDDFIQAMIKIRKEQKEKEDQAWAMPEGLNEVVNVVYTPWVPVGVGVIVFVCIGALVLSSAAEIRRSRRSHDRRRRHYDDDNYGGDDYGGDEYGDSNDDYDDDEHAHSNSRRHSRRRDE
jgi:hypothetical protein